ncbi:DEAD/DEAH box helicase [Desulfobacula sp.]|uniref:DEAD/DEAH box helicase n=1 Tax=Desulfobacula sp. TaxID=2593537 RepID=UPI0039B9A548
MAAKNYQELVVEILPPQDLCLTWESSSERVSQKQHLLDQSIHDHYVKTPDTWLLYLGGSQDRIALSASLDFFRSLSRTFLDTVARYPEIEAVRHRADLVCDPETINRFVDAAPLMIGREYLTRDLLVHIWEQLTQAFVQGIQAYPGSVTDFFKNLCPHIHLAGRVYFHLVENKENDYPFQFLATYAAGDKDGSPKKHRPLHHALEEYAGESLLELLTTVTLAAKQSPMIKDLMDTGDLFHHLAWDSQEAYEFLRQVPHFETCGIICRIPDWWKNQRPAVRLSISMGNLAPSHVGMDALLDFNALLMIGDDPITPEEATAILSQSAGLAWIKNRWVEVDTQRLEQVLAAYEQAMEMVEEGALTLKEALLLQLHPERFQLTENLTDLSFAHGDRLNTVVKQLSNPEQVRTATAPKALRATLRPYQQVGLNWLSFLDSMKFGACLADDMGLGKTLQVLGMLSLFQKREPDSMSLLIVPASLIANWEQEIQRFLPGLAYAVAHPGSADTGLKKGSRPPDPGRFDLIITTYAMAQRVPWMEKIHWRSIILDEAQAIKNPSTKQTRCVKKLMADTRIIMTGTPIENSLSDLWSLFDFLNPGFLGSAKAFKTFAAGLKKDPSGYLRLKKIISPYILRRMKTDPAIAPDLPAKVEMKTFPELSRHQIVLYTDFVGQLKKRLARADKGIERKGLILTSLIKFKQICNHPDQYLGTGGFDPEESGKFIRLRELCETIYAKRERVLVFTQFKEMIPPLVAFMAEIFHRQGCFLHGSMNVKKRKAAVEQFQGSDYTPFMVLSIKAGGVGLNLTRANHVIHFDRWWNPAVENQATDRAFLIGQKKGVLVHKFITKGTIEDHIDDMIESKKEMAQAVIPDTTGGWITEFDDKKLLEMFSLRL